MMHISTEEMYQKKESSDLNFLDGASEDNHDNDCKQNPSSNTGPNIKPMPWPKDDSSDWSRSHEDFLSDHDTQQNLCLEIASGAAVWHDAQWIRPPPHSSEASVLFPGSLRERGEFCMVEMGLMEAGRTFEWKVVNVEFQRLNEFPE